jgi:carboxyl-terminal processing protease
MYSEDDQQPSFFMPEQITAQEASKKAARASHHFPRLLGKIIAVLALVVIAFFGGWFSHQFFGNTFDQSNQSRAYSQLIQQAWDTLDNHYVDRKAVNYKQMSYAAINAMVGTLHDTGHTRFLTPADVQNENQQLSGNFIGIGVYLHQDPQNKNIVINEAIPTSPAQKAGIKSSDVIVAVNGTSVQGKDVTSVTKLIQGPTGTTVNITIKRPSTNQQITYKVTRAEIKVPNVIMHYIPESHIADIQVVQFADGISGPLKDDVTKAKKMGATRIILDLRNNPGGYLNMAIDSVSLFQKNGNVLLVQDSSGKRSPVAVTGNAVDTTSPIVVLVNENSASAAEITAGALKDNHRATIVGVKTFGTGTVLQPYQLADGSELLVGTQEWLTPGGQFIRNQGIKPDINVPLDPKVTPLTPDQENANNMSQQQILKAGDTQLDAAIQYLEKQK